MKTEIKEELTNSLYHHGFRLVNTSDQSVQAELAEDYKVVVITMENGLFNACVHIGHTIVDIVKGVSDLRLIPMLDDLSKMAKMGFYGDRCGHGWYQ